MITLATNQYWTKSSDSPKIQMSFYYDKRRNGANMEYQIKTSIRPLTETSSGSFGYAIFQDIKLDNVDYETGHTLKSEGSNNRWSTAIEYTTGWFTVSNKTSGNTNLKIRIWCDKGAKRDKTYEYSLEVDPAYPVITSFNVSQRDETSVQYNYSVDSGIDYAWYSINGGSWQGLPSNNVISGLSAGTGYNFKLKVRRQDSQLTAETGNVYQETYPYPSIIDPIPNFKIGDAFALWLNNPLSRQCEARILDANNNQMSSATSSDYIFGPAFNDTTSINNYYQSIPNSPSGNYKIRLIVSSLNRDTTINGGTYSVNEETNRPTFSDFSYQDVNATTLALTGDNQSIIPKYSNVRATISTSNKAVAKNYATMSSYKFTCGSQSASEDYSASSAVNITLNNVENGNFTIQAIDSRQLSTPITKSATTIVNYSELVKDVTSTLQRTGGVSEETKLTLKGTIWHQNFGQVTNSIKSVTYKYRVLNSGSEYTTGTTTITPTIDANDKFSFVGTILGDTSEGFDIANSYEVVVTVSDELSTVNYTFVISSGKPHIAYHKNGISIMGAYIPENGGKLQIDGVNIENLLGGGGGLNIGSIIEFAGSNIPTGFLKCEGQSLSKNQYPDLFDVIGYTYGGSGNNFNIPNLKGRTPVGVDSTDTNFDALGKTYGDKTHTHSINGHTHHYGLRYIGYYGDTQLEGSNGVGIMNYSSDNNYTLSGYGANTGSITTNNMNGGTTQSVQTVAPNSYQMEGNTSYTGMNTNNGSSYQPSFATYFIIKVENTVLVPQTSQVTSTYEESANDVYSCNYVNNLLTFSETTISIGSLGAKGEKYDQQANINMPAGYKPIAIASFGLTGSGYTMVAINKLQLLNTNKVMYSVRNTESASTGDLTLYVGVLYVKNG